VRLVAPGIDALLRSHWYLNVVPLLGEMSRVLAVSVRPTKALPVIVARPRNTRWVALGAFLAGVVGAELARLFAVRTATPGLAADGTALGCTVGAIAGAGVSCAATGDTAIPQAATTLTVNATICRRRFRPAYLLILRPLDRWSNYPTDRSLI